MVPIIGLSEDPLGFATGETNLNRYVWNSPANGRDPSGFDGTGNLPTNADMDYYFLASDMVGGEDMSHYYVSSDGTQVTPTTLLSDVTDRALKEQREYERNLADWEAKSADYLDHIGTATPVDVVADIYAMGSGDPRDATALKVFLYGDVANPNKYDENGNYTGMQYGIPPISIGAGGTGFGQSSNATRNYFGQGKTITPPVTPPGTLKPRTPKPAGGIPQGRMKGQRMKSTDNSLQQWEEIGDAQQLYRQGKLKKPIDSIEKSKNRAIHDMKRIRNLGDAKDLE